MTGQLVIAAVVVAVAAAVALVLRSRQRPAPPTQPVHSVPTQLDRADFPSAQGVPWLVVVFTSATCDTCADVWSKAQVLAADEVAVLEAEYGRDRALHQRYAIGAVPALVVADGSGVVQASFLGPVTATDLWAAVAGVRSPGEG